jgi:hypothetical protein
MRKIYPSRYVVPGEIFGIKAIAAAVVIGIGFGLLNYSRFQNFWIAVPLSVGLCAAIIVANFFAARDTTFRVTRSPIDIIDPVFNSGDQDCDKQEP